MAEPPWKRLVDRDKVDQLRQRATDAAGVLRQRLDAGRPGAAAPPALGGDPFDPAGRAARAGRWNAVGVAAVGLATSQLGPAGSLAGPLLQSLLGIEDAQAALLASIDENVQLLRDGPFRAGRLLLSEAHRLGPAHAEHRGFIEKARDRFYEAHGLAPTVRDRALVEFHLAFTWLLLGAADDSRHWLHQSYGSAMGVSDELARQAGTVKVLKSKWSVAAATWIYPVGLGVLATKARRTRAAGRAEAALGELLPFVAVVARTHNELAGHDELEAFELVGDREQGFELRPVPAAALAGAADGSPGLPGPAPDAAAPPPRPASSWSADLPPLPEPGAAAPDWRPGG